MKNLLFYYYIMRSMRLCLYIEYEDGKRQDIVKDVWYQSILLSNFIYHDQI